MKTCEWKHIFAWKRVLSIMLAMVMFFTSVPVTELVSAQETAVETVAETENDTVQVQSENRTTKIMIHFKNLKGWDKVYAHVWKKSDNSNPTGYGWPGVEVYDSDGDGYYTLLFDYTETDTKDIGVVFHNGSGSQTSDMFIANANLRIEEDFINEYYFYPIEVKENNENVLPNYLDGEEVRSPVVEGNKVTFKCPAKNANEVFLAGDMKGWGNQISMERDPLSTFYYEMELAPGKYEYKFIVNGKWIQDQLNKGTSNGNSLVIVSGLCGTTVTVLKGEEAELPAQLTYVDANGTEEQLAVTYTAANAEDASYVTINGNKVTVADTYAGKNLILTATASNGAAASVKVSVTDGTEVEVKSPEIDGNKVTFRYEAPDASNVYLAGSMNSWSGNTTAMTKDEDGIFTYTQEFEPGEYTYKFVVDGNWITDPLNENKADDGSGNINSRFVISGLCGTTATVKKGETVKLPAQLDYISEDGTKQAKDVTYTLAEESLADRVTIAGNKVTISENINSDEIILLAKTADGEEAKVTVTVSDKSYIYTIYVYSDNADRMSLENSALNVWDPVTQSLKQQDYSFTEKVELADGRTWLKVELPLNCANLEMIFKSAGSWSWKTADYIYKNTEEKENVTLYLFDGQSKVYESLDEVPAEDEQRYLVVEYTREDGNYDDMKLYRWIGSTNATYNFYELNGKWVAKAPIPDAETELSVGFIVKRGDGWDEKDGGDNLITFPADQRVVKVSFSNGKITKEYPYNKGAEIDKTNKKVYFYYRDDKLFLQDELASLEGKIGVFVYNPSNPSEEKIDAYTLTYDKDSGMYSEALNLEAERDYYYYYHINNQAILDAYNPNTITIDGKTYSKLRNKSYALDMTARVKNASMDYNDNNILYVDWEGKDGDSLDGFVVKELYADLSELGLGSQVAIDPELKALTIGCEQSVSAGEKTIKVTLLDDCGMTYTAETTVTVTERDKKEGEFDWDEAVIYFAVTDRFFDGNSSNNTLVDKEDETDGSRYHGGDWAGLTEKIDYLAELGVNTIWLSPIVENIDTDVRNKNELEKDGQESYAYHGYWASDFTKLNPHFGTEEELTALIEAAHAKGIKIMVDVVLNHAGYGTETYFNTIISGVDMIRNTDNTVTGDDKKSSLSGLPDFVTENEEVRNQLITWQTEWLSKFDIDYYRVDTVKHVDDTTWAAFKNALTEINPDFKLIGEYSGASYTNDGGELGSGTMDSLLDFDFKEYAKKFVLGNLTKVESTLAERNETLNNAATLGQFLSSHDENGLLAALTEACGNDTEKAQALMKVAASLQITAKGQPVIYYGEEIGQTGKNDYPYQTNRYDFDWTALDGQKEDNNSFYNHYKKMLHIRQEYSEVFAKGDRAIVAVSDTKGYDVVRRSYDGKNVYVALNVKDTENSVTFAVTAEAGSIFTDEYNGKTYTVSENGTITVTIPKAAEGGTAVLVLTEGKENEITDTNEVTVKLHYHRPDNDYTDWDVWFWGDDAGGTGYEFVEEDGDMVATITVEGRSYKSVNYIVRKGGGDWKEKDVDANQSIDISDIVSGTVHFYVESGVAGGMRILGSDVVKGNKVLSSMYEPESNTVTVTTSVPISGDLNGVFKLTRYDGVGIAIEKTEGADGKYAITLAQDLSAMSEQFKGYTLCFDGYEYVLGMPSVYSSEAFEEAYTYTGDDLGASWSKESTTFKVWAPTADSVQVALYESGTEGTDDLIQKIDLTAGEYGVWSVTVNGDLNGKYYTYIVSVNGETNEACDPYARTTGVNGKRAMVLDLDSTDPEGWEKDTSPNKGMNYTDAVIYELHVRDASIDESSGISAEHKGKFLGLTESGTTTANGKPTVLDYIADLGVTHVHLLPVYDYGSVDETRLDEAQFNWGYDPVNYNVPEGSYSTDPYNGEVRVKEMKEMVMTLHENNINVVMDVVYNHVYDAGSFCFNQIVPKYFSRTNADGSYTNASGCGNDTASERSMVRKYIVDSVLYWAEEYHIDGFRFDLVGLIDTETMNEVIDTVHEKYPDIIFYGEGWDMAGDTATKENVTMATQKNADETPELAYFSDTIRNLLAGDNSAVNPGYVSGLLGKGSEIASCFTATTSWCPNPTSTVNYASCHDNYTLMDKLNKSRADASEEDRIKMNNLAASVYMLSEGIPFIHAGEEFLRNKIDENGEVIHNSYNSSDYVNALRWDRLEDDKYADVVEYYKGLIAFRKNHEALRLTTSEEVAENVTYEKVTEDVVLFAINGKDSVEGEVSDGIVVIFNPTTEEQEINLYDYSTIEQGEWKVCINGEDAGIDVLDTITDGNVTVDAISAMVLVMGETEDEDSVYWENYREPNVPEEPNKPEEPNEPEVPVDKDDQTTTPDADKDNTVTTPDADNSWSPSLPTAPDKKENEENTGKPVKDFGLSDKGEKDETKEPQKVVEIIVLQNETVKEKTKEIVKAIQEIKKGQEIVIKISGTEADTNVSADTNAADSNTTNTNTDNQTAVVSLKVFETLSENKEKDTNLVIELSNGFSWTINANSIKTEEWEEDAEAIDFWAGIVENVVPAEVISSVAGEEQTTVEISLKHNGSFGLTAALDIPVGNEFAGRNAVLYYFNTETNEMEKMDEAEIGEDGSVRFLFTHASDYVLVIDETAESDLNVKDTETQEPAEKIENTENAEEGMTDDTKQSVLPVAGVICIVLLAAVAAVYFLLSKKKETEK